MSWTQEQLNWAFELERCANDFEYLCAKYLHIKSKTVIGFPTLKLNTVQRYLWGKVQAQWKRDGYVRQVWGKSRQVGSSSLVHALNFWRTNFHDYHNSFIIAHDEPSAYEQFDKIKTFYDALPDPLKSVTKYWAKGKIDFEDRRSRILCGHARNVNVGAGDMNHFLHMTEAARYPNADQVQSSIFPSISEARGDDPSFIIIESTSFFGGDWFKNFAEDAQAGRNGFEFHFVPYYMHDDYKRPLPHDFRLTEEERQLLRQYPLMTPENVNWRRHKRSEYAGNPVIFQQEYPISWEESWVLPSGTSTTFDSTRLDELSSSLMPGKRAYATVNGLEYSIGGSLEIWEAPVDGCFYDIGCLPTSERVWTDKGLIPIETVTDTTQLVNGEGKLEKPLHIMRREYDGEMCEVHVKGSPTPLRFTPEHPILVCEHPLTNTRTSSTDRRIKRPSSVIWKNAGNVKSGDIVRLPRKRFQPACAVDLLEQFPHGMNIRVDRRLSQEIILDCDFWWIVGLWLAEGYLVKNTCTVSWSFNKKGDAAFTPRFYQAVTRLFNREVTLSHPERSAVEHLVSCEQLYEFLLQFGQGAASKSFPVWIYGLPDALQLELFDGYRMGDGCVMVPTGRKSPVIACVSVSKSLLEGMQFLLEQQGLIAGLCRLRQAGVTRFSGKRHVSKTQETWSLVLYGNMVLDFLEMLDYRHSYPRVRRNMGSGWVDDKWIFFKVREVTKQSYSGFVHNFETPSHTYMAARAVVHNCDIAGGRTEKADWTVLEVVRRDTLEQVAEARGHWDPAGEEFLDLCYWTGMTYNRAQMIPDITGGWGHALLSDLQRRDYPNLWQWRRRDDARERVSNRVGFLYTHRDKALLVNNAVRVVMRETPKIHSDLLIEEMRHFLTIGIDEWGASPGHYDDLVNAWALALMGSIDEGRRGAPADKPKPIIRHEKCYYHDIDADLTPTNTLSGDFVARHIQR